jgi:hypothetical protein
MGVCPFGLCADGGGSPSPIGLHDLARFVTHGSQFWSTPAPKSFEVLILGPYRFAPSGRLAEQWQGLGSRSIQGPDQTEWL